VSVCRARSVLLGTFALAIAGSLIVPLAASAAEPSSLPYGQYVGSAVGDNGSEVIEVIVWVQPADGGQVYLTFHVPRIGASFGVLGTPEPVGSAAFKIPVTVNVPLVRLSGSGNLWLQPNGTFWVMRGVGSGSFRGSSGSGRGYAEQVRADPPATEQLVDALRAFGSFKAPDAGSPEAPPQFTEEDLIADAQKAAEAKEAAVKTVSTSPPWSSPQVFVVFIFIVFLAALGLFI
jgi:hypothetical protein